VGRHQIVEKLHQLRLPDMAAAYERQEQGVHCDGLTFDERLGFLVDAEFLSRQNRKLARLLQEAKLRVAATPEDINYRQSRGLDRGVMRALLEGNWLMGKQNITLTGPTGVGKTYLICALGHAACRQGYRVRYMRVPRLLDELTLSRGDGRYSERLRQLAKYDLLLLDDWGLSPLTSAQGRELLEVLDDRVDLRSTCVASQIPYELWHSQIPDPTIADSVMDRLLNQSHHIALTGDSMRSAAPALSS
jgi:DNA replication protein DnaC